MTTWITTIPASTRPMLRHGARRKARQCRRSSEAFATTSTAKIAIRIAASAVVIAAGSSVKRVASQFAPNRAGIASSAMVSRACQVKEVGSSSARTASVKEGRDGEAVLMVRGVSESKCAGCECALHGHCAPTTPAPDHAAG
jgi:hypothetical protein